MFLISVSLGRYRVGVVEPINSHDFILRKNGNKRTNFRNARDLEFMDTGMETLSFKHAFAGIERYFHS